MFRITLNYINTLALKTLILQLYIKCLSISNDYDTLTLKTLI